VIEIYHRGTLRNEGKTLTGRTQHLKLVAYNLSRMVVEGGEEEKWRLQPVVASILVLPNHLLRD
jgi:hypothetical protein